jgi:hypothetical protein
MGEFERGVNSIKKAGRLRGAPAPLTRTLPLSFEGEGDTGGEVDGVGMGKIKDSIE